MGKLTFLLAEYKSSNENNIIAGHLQEQQNEQQSNSHSQIKS